MVTSVDGEMVDITCGEDGCDTEGDENEDCAPILIPPNDPFFQGKCLEFIRSAAVTSDECRVGTYI